jgi:DNA uptake protein ComE-like DNA-binding protein
MKINFLNSILAVAVCSVTLVSCESETKEVTTEPTTTEVETPELVTVENTTVYNANLASQDELSLTGITDDLVAKVMANRPFVSMNELDALLTEEVNKEELYKHLFVPFNLNTTAEADFKMIPGVGDKMAHEFEEYRPYKSIKQFRKEIGKYVDEAEVTRYESYVFVPVELNTATEEDIKALPGVGDKMAHEFDEYRPYSNIKQFSKEIGKYVDDNELKRLMRLVYLKK